LESVKYGNEFRGTRTLEDDVQAIHEIMVRFQTSLNNLFLILHWHNVRCQQQELSIFLMRYSSSLLMLTAGARDSFQDGAQKQKAFCVLRFEVSRSVNTVQREFRARF
jgi:hypothetical protein